MIILRQIARALYDFLLNTVHGQRPMIIVPIDYHCNLPQNKTDSYVSQLIVNLNTFSRRENAQADYKCSKRGKRMLASIQELSKMTNDFLKLHFIHNKTYLK